MAVLEYNLVASEYGPASDNGEYFRRTFTSFQEAFDNFVKVLWVNNVGTTGNVTIRDSNDANPLHASRLVGKYFWTLNVFTTYTE